MKIKKSQLICLLIIVFFFGYSFYTYQSSLTPYVTFAQAKTAGSGVQVKGTLAGGGKVSPWDNGRGIAFALKDDAGEEATVFYTGAKPEGLEHATGIVAIGKYVNGQFLAERLLVKCPSKYQGSVSK